MWLILGLLWSGASAEVPPPDYRTALLERIEHETDRLLENGEPEQALAHVHRFRTQVTDDPRLAYEEALVLRHLERPKRAAKLLNEAIEGDPELAAAWYDLGEIRLIQGKLDEAQAAFVQATVLTEFHPHGWAGPYRLAEIAAFRGEADDFERQLEEALRRGFSFQRTVSGDARWAEFMKNPELASILRRLTTVYGEESVLESWRSPAPTAP